MSPPVKEKTLKRLSFSDYEIETAEQESRGKHENDMKCRNDMNVFFESGTWYLKQKKGGSGRGSLMHLIM